MSDNKHSRRNKRSGNSPQRPRHSAPNNRQRTDEISYLRRDFLHGISVPEAKTFVADPFQLRAIESLASGADTLVVAPTGTGKTYIAVEAIKAILAAGGRAIYTAPLKALSNAKFSEFRRIFEPQHPVGLLTGDRKISGDADVVVATTEIYRNELFRFSENYALVIFDEFHYLADSQRGPVWEESIILSSRSSRLLMLSASISNSSLIAKWIQSIRSNPINIISEIRRPVELRLGFLHPSHGIIPLLDGDRVLPEVAGVYSSSAKFFSQGRQQRGNFFRRKGDS